MGSRGAESRRENIRGYNRGLSSLEVLLRPGIRESSGIRASREGMLGKRRGVFEESFLKDAVLEVERRRRTAEEEEDGQREGMADRSIEASLVGNEGMEGSGDEAEPEGNDGGSCK